MENKKSGLLYGISGLLGVCLLTLFDQWTKYLAVVHLKNKNDMILIPGVFQLQYLENEWLGCDVPDEEYTAVIMGDEERTDLTIDEFLEGDNIWKM